MQLQERQSAPRICVGPPPPDLSGTAISGGSSVTAARADVDQMYTRFNDRARRVETAVQRTAQRVLTPPPPPPPPPADPEGVRPSPGRAARARRCRPPRRRKCARARRAGPAGHLREGPLPQRRPAYDPLRATDQLQLLTIFSSSVTHESPPLPPTPRRVSLPHRTRYH